MSKKKTALISILVIVSLAIVIVVVTSSSTPFFQPRSDLTPEHDEAENTKIATNDNRSNQTAATTIMPTTIDIVSTTSAFPFVQRWAAL